MPTRLPVAAALLVVASLAIAAPAKKKDLDPPKSSSELAISKALDDAESRVADCVLASAPDGLWTINVHAEISISGLGQMIACRAVLNPERKGAAATTDCVEQVLRETRYPKTGAGLITINRIWTFSMQE